jgi:hypothetical protein
MKPSPPELTQKKIVHESGKNWCLFPVMGGSLIWHQLFAGS